MNAQRLAAPLLRLASRVLSAVPPAEARHAVSALRAFTDGPSPLRYLAATRVLQHVERRHKLAALGLLANRRTEQSLDLLAHGTAVAPELVHALRALPPDARNGRRLTLIAEMLAAYDLIEARTAGALLELRQSLGPLPSAAAAQRRRKSRRG
ncbi:MAG: hypothetical protein ABUS79_05410 [Pseudomonadota bacterium]